MKVLVVGATGALGRPVVHLLRAKGLAVRALSRHPQQAGDLAESGAELVAGDLADPHSIERACAGVTHVLACAHGLLGRGRQRMETIDDAGHRRLIAAAHAAGVQRFVYTSAHGAAPDHAVDFFRTKHAIEQVLLGSGLDAVILRPTAFMEHHVHAFNGKGLLDKGKVQLIGPGTKPRNFVCAQDVAQFALLALLGNPPLFRSLVIGGPGNYSNLDVAALYARLAGVPLRVSHLPAGVASLLGRVIQPLHPGVARILRLSSLPDQAMPEHFEAPVDYEREFGVRMTPLDEFVRTQVQRAGITPRAG
ncbi:MAG: SDR family oxidoreductase [Rubrivivax sp.]|jgi:uncharacterized protein YbjT (DUF2867 family)|nr:SDR family oxidoreductase [Rubrivivax sp.]